MAERFEDCNEPRYLLFIHKQTHTDGRTTYPISFIVFMPENVPAHLKVVYTRPPHIRTHIVYSSSPAPRTPVAPPYR